jgi:hypothetical protein
VKKARTKVFEDVGSTFLRNVGKLLLDDDTERKIIVRLLFKEDDSSRILEGILLVYYSYFFGNFTGFRNFYVGMSVLTK